jgi:hypothetical protein
LTEHATVSAGRASGAQHPAAPLGSRQAHREASERDKRARRFLLRLSLINWGIAVVAWSVSAFLGITSPASIIVYSVLFVIGLFAVAVALLTYLLEKFAHRPPDLGHDPADHGETTVGAGAAGGSAAAAKTDLPAGAKPGAAAEGPAVPAGGTKSAAPPSDGRAAGAPQGGAATDGGKAAAGGDAPAAPAG